MISGKKICIIIATYNNQNTVVGVIEEVLTYNKNVIVVNDGSTDATHTLLSELTQITLIDYAQNRGKGHALLLAFRKAHLLGFTHAITIDSDGQHEPKNILDLTARLAIEDDNVLLMGARNMAQDGIPKKSSFGNKFSNFWYRVETGIKLSDTQTGFRAYPLEPISRLKFYTTRFEFEIEIIVRLAWLGVEVKEVPVLVNYPENRVSHFRPFKDFTRISILNTVLFFLAAIYYAPKRLFFSKGKKSFKNRIYREFSQHSDDKLMMSASVAAGLFFGIIPIWGFQMLVAFFFANLFKLNRGVVIIFANISLPPAIPFIIFFSYLLGGFVIKQSVPLPSLNEIDLGAIYLQLNQYVVGAFMLAFLMAGIGFAACFLIMGQLQKK